MDGLYKGADSSEMKQIFAQDSTPMKEIIRPRPLSTDVQYQTSNIEYKGISFTGELLYIWCYSRKTYNRI